MKVTRRGLFGWLAGIGVAAIVKPTVADDFHVIPADVVANLGDNYLRSLIPLPYRQLSPEFQRAIQTLSDAGAFSSFPGTIKSKNVA